VQAAKWINETDELPLKGTPESAVRLNEALKVIDKALTYDRSFAVAYVEQGRAKKRLSVLKDDAQLLRQALESIEIARTLDPQSDAALYNSACYKALLRKPIDEILGDLCTAVSLNPTLRFSAVKDGDLEWVRNTANERFDEALRC